MQSILPLEPSGRADARGRHRGIRRWARGVEGAAAAVYRGCTAFVVVLHLSPIHDSLLTSLLAKSTPMSVTTATDSQVLRKNCIYVIPPGFLLTLTKERTLRLSSLPSTHPRWTIATGF